MLRLFGPSQCCWFHLSWQTDAAAAAQGNVRASTRTGQFREGLHPRHVDTTEAESSPLRGACPFGAR